MPKTEKEISSKDSGDSTSETLDILKEISALKELFNVNSKLISEEVAKQAKKGVLNEEDVRRLIAEMKETNKSDSLISLRENGTDVMIIIKEALEKSGNVNKSLLDGLKKLIEEQNKIISTDTVRKDVGKIEDVSAEMDRKIDDKMKTLRNFLGDRLGQIEDQLTIMDRKNKLLGNVQDVVRPDPKISKKAERYDRDMDRSIQQSNKTLAKIQNQLENITSMNQSRDRGIAEP